MKLYPTGKNKDTSTMEGVAHDGAIEDSLPLDFSHMKKKKKKKKQQLNLCEFVAETSKGERNPADKENDYLDLENGKKNKKRAFNLRESDELLPVTTGKKKGDTIEGLGDDREVKDSLSPHFSKNIKKEVGGLKLKAVEDTMEGKPEEKRVLLDKLVTEERKKEGKKDEKNADTNPDILDLDSFWKKKKMKFKPFNTQELVKVLPDTAGNMKGGTGDGLADDREIKDSLSLDSSKTNNNKKKPKINLDELSTKIEKGEKKQEDKVKDQLINTGEKKKKDKKNPMISSGKDFPGATGKQKKRAKWDMHVAEGKGFHNGKANQKQKNVITPSPCTSTGVTSYKAICKMDYRKKVEREKPFESNSNNVVLQRKTFGKKPENFQDLKPPEWLEGVETPFKWAGALQRDMMFFISHRKLGEYKNHGSFYGFEKFAVLLVIIYKRVIDLTKANKDSLGKKTDFDQRTKRKDEEEGGEYFYELEEALLKCEETIQEMALSEDVMYSRIRPVFHHVLQATKSYIMFIEDKHEESKTLASQTQKVETMSEQCKAGIEGLKVRFIMSMYEDYDGLLPLMYKAIELDPQFGYWYYLTGKVKRQVRRHSSSNIDKEELDFFKQAVELERNPKFLVFLAQAYQEMAMFSRDTMQKNAIDDLLKKSVSLYSECWELKNNSAPISQRVGNGMAKMNAEFIDKSVAKEALLKALELSPGCISHIALGKYFYLHEHNDEKALEFFEKDAPSYFASGEIIRLKLIRDPDYDPYDDLQSWLNCNQNTLKMVSAYCDCGWYYLMYKKDLEQSVKCFWEAMKMDFKPSKIVGYRSYAFLIHRPINMVEVLVNEILLSKENNSSSHLKGKKKGKKTKEDKLLDRFLNEALEKFPYLSNMSPKLDTLDKLKQSFEHTIASKRRERYRTQNSEHNGIKEERVDLRNGNHGNVQEWSNKELQKRDGNSKRRCNNATIQSNRTPEEFVSWRSNR